MRGNPLAATVVSTDGPPAAVLGLIEWADHVVKLVGCDAPMPYGPVESCVGPAMVPPPLKVDAKQHAATDLTAAASDGALTIPIADTFDLASAAAAHDQVDLDNRRRVLLAISD